MNELYNILLVETEKRMCYLYKSLLSQQNCGFKINVVTDSEKQAVAYFAEYYPELVICDLKLAEGNGLSLIKKLRKLRENCRIVVISDCTDFASVRGAFVNGAYDFIPKSEADPERIEAMLNRLKKVLDESRESGENWRDKLRNMLGLIRDQQRVNETEIQNLLVRPELKVLNQEYQMVFFRMDNVKQVNLGQRNYEELEDPRGGAEDVFVKKYMKKVELRDNVQSVTSECIEDIFSDIPEHCLLFTKRHSGLILLPVLDQRTLSRRVEYLKERLAEVCFYSYSFTIGKVYSGRESFLGAYRDIMAYHEWKFYAGDGCILNACEEEQFHSMREPLDAFYNRLCQDIVWYREEEIRLSCEEIYQTFIRDRVRVSEAYGELMKLFYTIEKYLGEKGVSDPERFAYYREGIKNCDSLQAIRLDMERIIRSLLNYMMDLNINQYSRKVNELILFIEKNLNQHITLKSLSEVIRYSEIHTSRIFKKEVGVGVVQYINEKRMQKARELLESTDLKIKEIARQVGVEDQLYFNKQFHKQFQISPSQYRKNLTNKGKEEK